MTVVLAICLSQVTTASGAADATPSASSATSSSAILAARVSAPEKCPSAHGAVRFYSRKLLEWRAKMGAATLKRRAQHHGCPRYLANLLKRQARKTRMAYERWIEYHWHWQAWLPANWRALGACETGYGRQPGNWTWDSGSYVSAFGIYRQGYADDAHRIGNLSWDETKRKLGRLPTPREQYEAALSHYRTHGDGWGCPGP